MSCSSSVATAQSRFSSSPYQENPYQIDTREHKLRIVERLGTVGNALQSEVFSQQNSSKIPMIGPGTDTPRARTDSITGTASAQETKELTIQEETVVEVIDPPKVTLPLCLTCDVCSHCFSRHTYHPTRADKGRKQEDVEGSTEQRISCASISVAR